MRLLIVTQAVDRTDSVLGFFHRWIIEFAKRCEHVHVICLKEGEHDLPPNVSVRSLGKEGGISRMKYLWRFYTYIWKLRNEYAVVFVHMNQEYVLLGGTLWWLWGKRVVLWRNHLKGSLWTRIATWMVHTVCYTSSSAYVARYKNAVQMPLGIDTDFFRPSVQMPEKNSILFLGRLDAVKRPEVFLQALEMLAKDGVTFTADIIGDPTPGREAFARDLKQRFSSIPNVRFKPAIRNDEAVTAYNSHAIYVNLTPSGSFDKTIGEAMACGCIPVITNGALKDVLPEEFLLPEPSVKSLAQALHHALSLPESERVAITDRCRLYIEGEHSLSLLVSRLSELYIKDS